MVDSIQSRPYLCVMSAGAAIPDDEAFDDDLDLVEELPALARAGSNAEYDVEGPIDSLDEEDDTPPLDELMRGAVDDLFGFDEPEHDLAFDELGPCIEAHPDDADGPLLEDDADLGFFPQDEPVAALHGHEEEGGAADESSFDLPELPPLGGDLDDGALFEDALDDLDFDPEPARAPAPRRPPTSAAQDRSPAT
ncbi:MAG: hypothetical protein H5U40_09790 [Polyangiaceae bacterium]|nr:hypothetical protein [Polyangiaceae bacterium]